MQNEGSPLVAAVLAFGLGLLFLQPFFFAIGLLALAASKWK